MKATHILKECFLATCIILLVTFFVKKIPISNEFRKAIFQGFGDFDIYDLHYSGNKDEKKSFDENIILVEIGADRSEIADQLELINRYNPKVIGIDAVFESPGDELLDFKFKETIKGKTNLIFASRFIDNPKQKVITPFFNQGQYENGYANFIGSKYSVNRMYPPSTVINGKDHDAFTTAIAKKFDSKSYTRLRSRNNDRELIHYKGNLERYLSITRDDLKYYDTTNQLTQIFTGKIVLLGFFVKQDSDRQTPLILDDLHYSPMNEIVFGKSYPDMYGVVIHANILSMILSGNYATLASDTVTYLFAFFLTALFYYYIFSQYKKTPHPNHGKLMLIQYLGIIILLYLFLQLFDLFLYKTPLEPIMIALVLSLELMVLYKMAALWLHKKFGYQTVFSLKHDI